jgi:hypothetical protein
MQSPFNLECEKSFPILRKLVEKKSIIKITPRKEGAKPRIGLYEDHCGRYVTITESGNISITMAFFVNIESIELL